MKATKQQIYPAEVITNFEVIAKAIDEVRNMFPGIQPSNWNAVISMNPDIVNDFEVRVSPTTHAIHFYLKR